MKKCMVIVGMILFTLPIAQAGMGIFGTYWNSKDYDDLYGGGIRLGMPVGTNFGVEARASYLRTDLFSSDDNTLELIPLEALATWVFHTNGSVKPYIGAGAGYYIKNLDFKASNVWEDAKTKDSVGYFGLAGLNVVRANTTFFGEAKYNLISNDDKWQWRGSDVSEKYSLDGLSVNIGIKFSF